MSIEKTISEYLHVPDDAQRADDIARYVAGIMSDIERASFRKHLDACAICAEAVELIEHDADEWDELLRAPAESDTVIAAPTISEHGLPPTPSVPNGVESQRRWLPWAGALALAVAAVLTIFVTTHPTPKPGLVAKGDFVLAVAVVRDGRTRRVQSGDTLSEGDQVGFFYTASQEGHLTLLHIDEHGAVATILPERGDAPVAIEAADDTALPAGGVVSTGETCEWFVGAFSRQSFSVAVMRSTVERAVRRTDPCARPRITEPGVTIALHEIRR